MNDIDFLLWLSTFAVVAWPALVTVLVYLIQRSRITRPTSYFIAGLLTGYVLSLLTPLVIVFGAILLGAVAEMAAVYAILLATPVIVVLTTVSAVYWSGRYGEANSEASPTDARSV